MKFTLSWLKEHLDTMADVGAIADALNRIGHEVEGIDNPADKLRGFHVARVLTAAPHPQADKLQVLTVDSGHGAPLQVVCGAPNARAGLVGVFGSAGAIVPANGMELRVAAIRGVESNGMMCSSRELELGDDHDGIIELPADSPVGTAFADYAALNDPVIDVSITPNRQDCMGVRGIARDLAAAGLGTLKPLRDVYRMPAEPLAVDGAGPDVRTDDRDGCPAFYAQEVRGLRNGTAPAWMLSKLNAVGQKPISALVDITNFITLDLGRPLHVYDKAKLSGGLVARRARAGEQVLALNGKTYALNGMVTVIADDAQVHDIGGIMGGEDSGVSDTTTDVIIECAYFTPDHIARTGQQLNLTSDARQRFERGVDPAFLDDGLAIATWLVLEHCGGTPSPVTRSGEPPVAPRNIAFDPAHTLNLGGVDVAPDRQAAILRSLGFGVRDGALPWTVIVPTWRRDVMGSADLVEEVTRIVGFDAIPSTPLPRVPGVARPTATDDQLIDRRLRRAAAALGFHEAVTWSFIPRREADLVGGASWSVANPISEDMHYMRPSLLPGLLSAAQRNADRGASSIRLFEIGRRYMADAERQTLTLVMSGDKSPRDWQHGKAAAFTAHDAKQVAMALLDAAGAPVDRLQVMDVADTASAIWHPGQSASLRLGAKTVLAEFGALHPVLTKAFDLDGPVMAVSIYPDALPTKRASGTMRDAFSPRALQAVTRDFAFLVPYQVAAGDLVRAIRGADKTHIVDARLFDRFTGTGVPDGQASLAVEVTMQPGDKSFTDADLKRLSDAIVAAAAKLGAVLRG